jgi:hypothetical protein
LLDKTNTAGGVWVDAAYRSAANEAFLARRGFVSRIHRKRPMGGPMPEATRRANAQKSKIRSRVEHVFAELKDRMGLLVRTVGLARATTKIGVANLVYNMRCLSFLRRTAAACRSQRAKSPPPSRAGQIRPIPKTSDPPRRAQAGPLEAVDRSVQIQHGRRPSNY